MESGTERRLGKGLAQILETSAPKGQGITSIRVDQIRPSRFQPRSGSNQEHLAELKESIKKHGVIQPVIVRPVAHGIYELVAGERRWRACQAIGIQEVPAIVRAVGDQQALEYGIIENVQRKDLNPIEEANGLSRLIKEFGYTQDQVSEAIGKDRATISNSLRLLNLPAEMRTSLASGKISAGHAKALLGVESDERRERLYRKALAEHWSVRALEEAVRTWQPRERRAVRGADAETMAIEARLRGKLGTKVRVVGRKRGGRIIIEYYSQEELTRILEVLGDGSV